MERRQRRGPGRPPGGGGPAAVPTDDEIRRVLGAMHGPHTLRNRALFTLQLATGMRVGELATLTVADLVSRGTVRRSFRLRKEHTKYGRAREVFLENPIAREALGTYFGAQRRNASPSEPFFLGQRGPMTPNGLAKLFGQLYRAADVPGASSHSGRRWYGSTLKQHGVSLKTIQRLLGHASLRTTELYLEVTPVEMAAAAGKIAIPTWTSCQPETTRDGPRRRQVRNAPRKPQAETLASRNGSAA